MTIKAILFGSIGTLVETSEIQRAAFNEAFAAHGLDWVWDRETYRARLKTSGGVGRIQDYARERNETVDANAVHRSKTDAFQMGVTTASLLPRDGVMDLIRYAHEEGIKLGFVTSTSKQNVDSIFKGLGNTLTRNDFHFVGDASQVTNSKPAPDIYVEALKALDISADEAIAIEDSEPSLQAALRAGVPCIAFPGENAVDQDYSGAVAVVDRLSVDLLRANAKLAA